MLAAQILGVRTVLEMLFEGVAALDGGGGEGGLVDVGHSAGLSFVPWIANCTVVVVCGMWNVDRRVCMYVCIHREQRDAYIHRQRPCMYQVR